MSLAGMRLAVYPGQGVVARLEHAVLLVLGGEGAVGAGSRLVDACRTTKGLRGRLREIAQGSDMRGLAFLALAEAGDSMDIFVHGVMKVDVTLEGSHMEFSSGEATGWLEESLRGKPVSIAAGESAVWTGSPPMFDLEKGVVPGTGFEMVARVSAAAASAPTAAPDEASTDADADTVLKFRPAISEAQAGVATEPQPAPADSPGPEAVPKTAVAASPFSPAAAPAPPPPLGRLASKDGNQLVIDRGVLIGRQPAEAPEVASGQFAAFVVPATEAGVSRVHAEIRVDNRLVLVADRNSANGTFVKPPGMQEWIRLEPGHAVQIVHGTGVAVGPYEMTFEPA